MSNEYQGIKFVCDNCKKEQLIVIEGNYPAGWSSGCLSVKSGHLGPKIDLCGECWPATWSAETKKATLCSVLRRMFTREANKE